MTSPAGWYPDPGGQRGTFRYWDGSTWSAQTSRTPATAAPITASQSPSVAGPDGSTAATPRGRTVGLWLALAAVVVVVALVAWLAVYVVNRASSSGEAGGVPSANQCPAPKAEVPVNHPADGRIYGGQLSYPALGPPWQDNFLQWDVPFGRDIRVQAFITEKDYDDEGANWYASVLVGELVAGDGFYTPQEGSEIVVRCLISTFYGGAAVTREDSVSRATSVSGKDAWLTETHLAFEVPGLQAKGETVIVMIVATSAESSSLFYASVPDNASQYLPDARKAMAGLTATG